MTPRALSTEGPGPKKMLLTRLTAIGIHSHSTTKNHRAMAILCPNDLGFRGRCGWESVLLDGAVEAIGSTDLLDCGALVHLLCAYGTRISRP